MSEYSAAGDSGVESRSSGPSQSTVVNKKAKLTVSSKTSRSKPRPVTTPRRPAVTLDTFFTFKSRTASPLNSSGNSHPSTEDPRTIAIGVHKAHRPLPTPRAESNPQQRAAPFANNLSSDLESEDRLETFSDAHDAAGNGDDEMQELEPDSSADLRSKIRVLLEVSNHQLSAEEAREWLRLYKDPDLALAAYFTRLDTGEIGGPPSVALKAPTTRPSTSVISRPRSSIGDKILQFQRQTNTTQSTARAYLERAGGRLTMAVELFERPSESSYLSSARSSLTVEPSSFASPTPPYDDQVMDRSVADDRDMRALQWKSAVTPSASRASMSMGMEASASPSDVEHAAVPHSARESRSRSGSAAMAAEAEQDRSPDTDFLEAFLDAFLDFPGCSAEEHRHADMLHVRKMQQTGQEHHDLSEINDLLARVPYVLDQPTFSVDPDEAPDEPYPWNEAIHGRADPHDAMDPPHVCLHKDAEQCLPRRGRITFDVDSLLAFASTLAVARKGIKYSATQSWVMTIKSDLHVNVSARYEGEDGRIRNRKVSIHKVPHYHFGQLTGYSDIKVYFLFPRLYKRDHAFNALPLETFQKWTDKVLLPAINHVLESPALQHQPSSARASYLNSMARSRENASRAQPPAALSQGQHFDLQEAHLGPIWEEILRFIGEEPGLGEFKGVMILLNAKNIKSATQARTLPLAWERFWNRFSEHVDEACLDPDNAFFDLAKEATPPDSYLPNQEIPFGKQPQVYMWRRCCLEKQAALLDKMSLEVPDREAAPGNAAPASPNNDHPDNGDNPASDDEAAPAEGTPEPSRSFKRTFYHICWLRDVANMTLVPKKSSRAFRLGIRYTQNYSLIKGPLDADKHYPFANTNIEGLSLDPSLRLAWAKTAHAKTSVKSLKGSYKANGERVHVALTDARKKSFGLRQEHRVRLDFAKRLADRASWLEDQPGHRLQGDPLERAAVIQAETFMRFQRLHVNKFCAAFEAALAHCQNDFIGFEETRAMVALLRCVRYSVSAQALSRDGGLWWDSRTLPNRCRQGLGLGQTISQHGYGWLLPKLDVTHWRFHEHVRDQMVFGNPAMGEAYRRYFIGLRGINDDFRKVSTIRDLLRHHSGVHRTRLFLIRALIWMSIQSFKRSLFQHIKDNIRPEHRDAALAGHETLDYTTLSRILTEAPHLASGNKTKHKNPAELYQYLWCVDDEEDHTRLHWNHLPYRKLWVSIRKIVREEDARRGGLCDFEDLELDHELAFHRHCWMWPIPTPQNFMSRRKVSQYRENRRVWFAIAHDRLSCAPLDDAKAVMSFNRDSELHEFSWAKTVTDAIEHTPEPQHVDFEYAYKSLEEISAQADELSNAGGGPRCNMSSPQWG